MATIRMHRLLATFVLVTLSLAALAVLVLAAPQQTLAHVDEVLNAPARLTATAPLSIPLPNPMTPMAPPQPGVSQPAGQPPAHTDAVHAVPFRPQLRLQRGALPPNVKLSAHKPDRPTTPDKTVQPPRSSTTRPTTDIAGPLQAQGWTIKGAEGFEGSFPSSEWTVADYSNDGYDRKWGKTNYARSSGIWSAWPAAGGTNALNPAVTTWYTDNLSSWMEYGPVDFSGMYDVFASFQMYYHTEADYDWIYFCISTDQANYSCDSWSGYSFWSDYSYWLTSYAGYSHVWFAWYFYSDNSVSTGYYGPYVDDIYIWGNDEPPTPPVESCVLDGQLIQNCGFETGDATNWATATGPYPGTSARLPLQPERSKPIGVAGVPQAPEQVASTIITDIAPAEGTYHALMYSAGAAATDSLYQEFAIPAGVSNVTVNYWYGVTTNETVPGYDFFCAALQDTSGNYLVDLGCMDTTDTDNYWHEFVYSLTGTELTAVNNKTVRLVFDLYNDSTLMSFGWVDFARVYATGGSGGAAIDPNEPNDDSGTATLLGCGQTITTGVIGDAVGGSDVDWFKLTGVPAGRMNLDIDARTQAPQSSLDSVMYLYDNNLNVVGVNDDDGVSLDSYISYTNTVAGATYYARVSSYTGEGGPGAFYAIKAACNAQGSQVGGTTTTSGITGTWTVMLYLNAEDAGFASILTQYRTDLESFIGSKSSFLTVTILYDPPGNTGMTRYVVQPNGAYTDGVNRWNLAEANMGDPNTLNNFVSWSMDQFPADNYYLAIDDHGNGVYGISFDATSLNDPLTMPEVYSALKSATQNGARKIDILDYEACLMGLTENAYDIQSLVHYLVASEQISWGINTYPTYFNDLTSGTPPSTVGQRIVTRYSSSATNIGYPHTIALIDTTQLGAVNTAINNFAHAITATNTYSAVLTARRQSQAFAADAQATDAQRAEYIDLWSFADRAGTAGLVSSPIANAVKTAVNSAVVIERHASGGVDGNIWDHSGAHGLSIYYPSTRLSSAFSPYINNVIYKMSLDGLWDEFLQWSVPGTGRGMYGTRASFRLTNDSGTFVFRYIYLPIVRK